MRLHRLIVLAAVVMLICGLSVESGVRVVSAADGSITLAWDANTEADLAGYELIQGTTPDPKTWTAAPLPAGLATTITVPVVGYGMHYYAVRAYDTAGNRSGPSNVVAYEYRDTTPPAPPVGCRVVATP